VLVIEHNLDVIKVADHVIDLGPEGGDKGGQIVVEGTPETVARHKTSHTGRFLREVLERDGKSLEERKSEARQAKPTINQIRGSRAKKDRIHMDRN
jgi:excinuclease ABC subunit A